MKITIDIPTVTEFHSCYCGNINCDFHNFKNAQECFWRQEATVETSSSNDRREEPNTGKNDWDEKLDGILFAYRTSQQKSPRVTPFELMYCRYVFM